MTNGDHSHLPFHRASATWGGTCPRPTQKQSDMFNGGRPTRRPHFEEMERIYTFRRREGMAPYSVGVKPLTEGKSFP